MKLHNLFLVALVASITAGCSVGINGRNGGESNCNGDCEEDTDDGNVNGDDDIDDDGWDNDDDCADRNPNINPGADEIPGNGIDEDCDSSNDGDDGNDDEDERCSDYAGADLCLEFSAPREVEKAWCHVELVQDDFADLVDESSGSQCYWNGWDHAYDVVVEDAKRFVIALDEDDDLDGVRFNCTFVYEDLDKLPDGDEPYGDDDFCTDEDGRCDWLAFGTEGDDAEWHGSVSVRWNGQSQDREILTMDDSCSDGPGSSGISDF